MTTGLTCVTTASTMSNTIPLTVTSSVVSSVSIVSDQTTVCQGTPVTLDATPVNGGAASYKWFVGTVAQTETSNKLTYTPSNGDAVKVEMTSSLSCTNNSTATSNVVGLKVNDLVTPTVTIKADQNPICSGEKVVFSSTVANQGTSPVYDWLVNGTSTGVQTATYTSSTLTNKDKVSVVLTSSETCSSGAITSSTIVLQTKAPVVNSKPVPNQNLAESFTTYQIDLSAYFTGNGLIYTITTPSVVNLQVQTQLLEVSYSTSGVETITVTAQDACGATADASIRFDVATADPVINILTIKEGDVLSDPKAFEIKAEVTALNGKTIASIDFIVKNKDKGSQELLSGDVATLSAIWNGLQSGNYSVKVVVKLTDGTELVSDQVNFTASIINGFNKTDLASDITVYPNPAQNDVTISFEISNSSKVSIEMFNQHGTLLMTKKGEASDAIHMHLPEEYNNGIYMLKIYSDNEFIGTKKLLIYK